MRRSRSGHPQISQIPQIGFRTESYLCNLRNLRIVSGSFRVFRGSMLGPGSEQPLDKGDDSLPEESDGEESAEQPADEKLKDVATGTGVKVAIRQLKSDRRNEQQKNQARQEPTIVACH